MKYTHERTEFDEEPVYYCKSCHSLNVVSESFLSDEDWDGAYCADCHSTDIGQCNIEDWLAVEREIEETRRALEWKK